MSLARTDGTARPENGPGREERPIFSSPFPPGIAFTWWREEEGEPTPLLPAERAMLKGDVSAKRMRDFTLGRHCARQALTRLKFRTLSSAVCPPIV